MKPIGYLILRAVILLAFLINVLGFSNYFKSSIDISSFDLDLGDHGRGEQAAATATAHTSLNINDDDTLKTVPPTGPEPTKTTNSADDSPASLLSSLPSSYTALEVSKYKKLSEDVTRLQLSLTQLTEENKKAALDLQQAEDAIEEAENARKKVEEEKMSLQEFKQSAEAELRKKAEEKAEADRIQKEKDVKASKFREPFEKIRQEQLDDESRWVTNTADFSGFESHDLEPKGHQIAIVSGFDNGGATGKYKDINNMAMSNRQEYADYHGYIHQFINFTEIRKESDEQLVGFKSAWLKARAIRQTFDMHPEVEWVWWLDTDVIIMNPELDLAHHLLNEQVLLQKLSYGQALLDHMGRTNGYVYPNKGDIDYKNIDLIISQDTLGLNAGSFFLRRSHFSRWLTDLWEDPILMEKQFSRAEQDALIHLVQHHELLRSHLGLVPQRLINSYDFHYSDGRKKYQPGDFLIHFAGRNSFSNYMDTWDYYWSRRFLLPEDKQLSPVKSTNPQRKLSVLQNVDLNDKEIAAIQSGNYDHSELYRRIGDKLTSDEWTLLTVLTSDLAELHKG